MGQHEEADRFHAELAGLAEVLDRDVRLGAVRRDAGHGRPDGVGLLQVVHGAEPREHEDGDLRLCGLVHGCLDEIELVDLGEAVVERGPAEAVAVGDLDDLNAGAVERADHAADLPLGELVRHRVGAVAQRRVGDPQIGLTAGGGKVRQHLGLGDQVVDGGGIFGTDGHIAHGVRLLPSRWGRSRWGR